MHTGTNLMKNILTTSDLQTNLQIPVLLEDIVWKHTLDINKIQSILNNKDNYVIVMYKNLYNWLYSIKKHHMKLNLQPLMTQ